MKKDCFIWSRNQIIKKIGISGYIWDQLCFLNGNIPIGIRKIGGKNKKSLFFKKES